MILPVCLGILLVGIVMIPDTFAGDGCGPGTVLIDGVCELAPVEESSTGCGPGTIMVNGVCKLDEKTESSSMSIEPLYVIIAVVAIGGVIGGVFAVRKGSKTSKPAKRDLEDYESSDERMKDVLGFFNEATTADVPATDLLTQIDQLLYALMDYEPAGEGWRDEDEYERREVMKLKEILPAAAA